MVERKHKHLLEVAWDLLFQAHMPKVFWGDCVLTITYLINKMPTPVLNWKSPYEVLHNKLPNYSYLRTFKCLCFAANIASYKDKFDARGVKCMFLGYAMGHKGYKVVDLATRGVFVSRDVQFHESIFPYSNYIPSTPTIPLSVVTEHDNDNINSSQ